MLNQKALEEIRTQNFSEMLQVMRQLGVCSLSQITKRMDVGLTTVKKCVEEGVRCGMILAGESATSTGGRRAQQFLINSDYQYYLLIITDDNDLIFKVYDFKNQCVEEVREHFPMPQYYQILCEKIRSFFSKYKVGTIGLSLPCVVKNGVIMDWYYNRTLQGFDIQTELKSMFSAHVIIQNDMKLTVLGASVRSGAEPAQNLVTAQFGHNGIGVGEMVNGHILEGMAGFAGEVGYIPDVRRNIMGISYIAKIVRDVIICINPQKIVFYRSKRQNDFQKIFEGAIRGLPEYAVPEYEISDGYLDDITTGLFQLIDLNGFFKKEN